MMHVSPAGEFTFTCDSAYSHPGPGPCYQTGCCGAGGDCVAAMLSMESMEILAPSWPPQAGHHKLHKVPNTTLPPGVASGEGTALYTTLCNLHDPLADSP